MKINFCLKLQRAAWSRKHGRLFWKKKCLEVWFEGIQTDVSVGQDGEGHSIQKGWRRKRCRNQQWRGWYDKAGGWEDKRQSGEYRKVCKVAAYIETICCHGRLSQKQTVSCNNQTYCSKYWHHPLYHQPYYSKSWHHPLYHQPYYSKYWHHPLYHQPCWLTAVNTGTFCCTTSLTTVNTGTICRTTSLITAFTTVNTGTICRTTSLTTAFTTVNTGTICCTTSLSKYWHHPLYHQPYCSKNWHHPLSCKDKHCWRRATKRQGGSAYGVVVAWQRQLWSTHRPLTAPAVASQGQQYVQHCQTCYCLVPLVVPAMRNVT